MVKKVSAVKAAPKGKVKVDKTEAKFPDSKFPPKGIAKKGKK